MTDKNRRRAISPRRAKKLKNPSFGFKRLANELVKAVNKLFESGTHT